MEKIYSDLIKIAYPTNKKKIQADVSIGFMSNIPNIKDNYFSVYNCPNTIIKPDFKRKDRVRFEMADKIFLQTNKVLVLI